MKQIQSRFKQLFSSQLRLNMLSGSISTGISFFASAIKYPIYIHYLGYEHYGTWLLLSMILTFAQLGLLGIGTATNKLIAEEYGKNNTQGIQAYFMTALCMLAVVGILFLGICIFLKYQIISLMGLKGDNILIFESLLPYMAVFSIGVLAYQLLNSVLSGVGRIDISNYSQTALQVLPLIISVPFLIKGFEVNSLLIANVFAYLAVSFFNFSKINQIVSVNILNVTSASWMHFNKLIRFGGNIFFGYMVNMLVLPLTKTIITRSIGVEAVPVFELTYRVGMQIRSIFEVALKAIMPEISKLSSEENQTNSIKIKKLTSGAFHFVFLGATPLYILIFFFADIIFKIWLGSNFIPSVPNVFRVMLFTSYISLMGVVPYYIAMGYGRVRRILFHHLISAIATISLLGLTIELIENINIIFIAWCFVPGTFMGTIYILLFKSKQE